MTQRLASARLVPVGAAPVISERKRVGDGAEPVGMMGAIGQRRARPPPLGAGPGQDQGVVVKLDAPGLALDQGPVAPLVRGPREEHVGDGVRGR